MAVLPNPRRSPPIDCLLQPIDVPRGAAITSCRQRPSITGEPGVRRSLRAGRERHQESRHRLAAQRLLIAGSSRNTTTPSGDFAAIIFLKPSLMSASL